MNKPFEAGDIVAVFGCAGWSDHIYKRWVTRTLKKYIELNDGSKWNHLGGQYPYQPYSRGSIAHWDVAIDERYKKQNLLARIEKSNFKAMPIVVLQKVVDVLEELEDEG